MILNALSHKDAIAIGFCVPSYNGVCHLAAITGTTKLVTYLSAKSMDFIWKSIRYHSISYTGTQYSREFRRLHKDEGTGILVPVYDHQVTCSIKQSGWRPFWTLNEIIGLSRSNKQRNMWDTFYSTILLLSQSTHLNWTLQSTLGAMMSETPRHHRYVRY